MPETRDRNLPEQIDLFPTKVEGEEREKEPTEVARLQILRAKSIKEIKDDLESGVKPEDLFFVNSLWIEKTAKSVAPNRVMQIGGKRSGDESLETTAIREMLEETHLRPIEINRLGQDQEYTFRHSKRGDVTNRVAYFNVRILPSDRGVQLNPDEDKIKKFHILDLVGVGELLGKKDSNDSKVVEHLQWWREDGDSSFKIELDQDETVSVQAELIYSMQIEEMFKKINILFELANVMKEKLGEEEYAELSEKLMYFKRHMNNFSKKHEGSPREILKDIYSEVQNLYRSFVTKYKVSPNAILNAADMANLKEEMYYGGESGAERYLRFMVTLFNSQEWEAGHFDAANENTDIKELLSELSDLFNELYNLLSDDDKDKIKKTKDRKIEVQDGLDIISMLRSYNDPKMDLKIERIFIKLFKLESRDISNLTQEANKFVTQLANKSANLADDDYPVNLIEQLSEIKKASIAELLEIAVVPQSELRDESLLMKFADTRTRDMFSKSSVEHDEIEYKETRNRIARELIFEARRKLVLIKLFEKAFRYYDSELENYDGDKINSIWKGIIGDEEYSVYKVFRRDEGAIDDPNEYSMQLLRPQEARSTLTQVNLFNFNGSKERVFVSKKTRVKTIQSIVRKFLVRGLEDFEKIHDIHGRAYTLQPDLSDGNNKQSFVKKKYKDEGGIVDDRYKDSDGSYKEYSVVRDIIDKLESNKGVRVIGYKPTNFDRKVVSSGPGGGGNVRYAKFYVEFTNSDGSVNYEEIQIFTPDEEWIFSSGKKGHSGDWYKEQKEQDDTRYEIQRLSDTQSLRSFIELVWPVQIYGDLVHTLYSKEHGKNGVK